MSPLREKSARPRGIVRGPGRGTTDAEPVRLLRFEPPEPLRDVVEHLWIVRWILPAGQTLEQATLPHPVVHWTVEGGKSVLLGVVRGRFLRRLTGSGRVVAVKFRPAGLCTLSDVPLNTLTDREVPAAQVLGEGAEKVVQGIDALGDEDAAERLATVLLGRPRREDAEAAQARALVEYIERDHDVTKVETVARHAGVSVVSLQRLFRTKVGVSPKWVIQRYRMHEALERVSELALKRPGPPRLASVAYELGFTDQAHFCRVFKQFIGQSPAAYAEQVRGKQPRRTR